MHKNHRSLNSILPLSLFLALLPSAFAFGAEFPEFSKVEGLVQRHFASMPAHQPGDLISRSQVQPLFDSCEQLGWKVKDSATILNSVLPDSNYLVQEFRTPKGQTFMRKVATSPRAFDQLDQISRLPGGKLMIKDFLRFPNSDLTFTDKSPLDVGRLARFTPRDKRSGTPTQADFDKPTGRIYTVKDLVTRLRKSYDAEVERRGQLSRN